MNETMKIIFGLVGGLAIFIYGMNMMSECLQKAAGEKMKKILALLTKNPILGVLAGALTTAVLQSSSATTVMTIGFVSAGLMSLPQAISIILGANIGTTMTAQIIAFKITDYIYLFIFAGFLISFILLLVFPFIFCIAIEPILVVLAFIISIIPSASIKFILPFKNALLVNSPGSANLQPFLSNSSSIFCVVIS